MSRPFAIAALIAVGISLLANGILITILLAR